MGRYYCVTAVLAPSRDFLVKKVISPVHGVFILIGLKLSKLKFFSAVKTRSQRQLLSFVLEILLITIQLQKAVHVYLESPRVAKFLIQSYNVFSKTLFHKRHISPIRAHYFLSCLTLLNGFSLTTLSPFIFISCILLKYILLYLVKEH